MALIPENVQVIEIDAQTIETEETVRADAADFLIDFERGRWTSQRITGDEKALQWLGIGCMTERDQYGIYGDFGIYRESLIEQQMPRDITEGEMVRGIEELGAQHEGIRSLEVDVEFTGNKSFVDITVNGQTESVVIE